MKLTCGCEAHVVYTHNAEGPSAQFKITEPCNEHKSDLKFLATGALDRLVGKQVRLRDNRGDEKWKYAGYTGIFLGTDPQFPMDVMVEIPNGTTLFTSPDDIQEVLEA